MENTERQTGEIVFWNGVLGFIKIQNSDHSIFFHINNIDKNYKFISLLDKVTFAIREAKIGRHIGEPTAFKIKYFSRGSFSEHKRTIGVLRDWNGKFGFLDSPQLDKTVFLFHSRLINKEKEIQNGDYFIFSPVKSSKNPEQLFAFFAYLLEDEQDIEFLRQQQTDNSISQVKEIISSLIRLQADKPVGVRFELELQELINQKNNNIYQQVNQLIKQYKEKFDFSPSFQRLKIYLQEKYLIQLWENEVIKPYDYDLETMLLYFHNSTADTKRSIVNRFSEEDKYKILQNHFNLLKEKGKVDKTNNDIKTFLNIVYRNKQTQQYEIYKETEKYVLDNLSPKDNVSLWLNDYIEDLPERYIIDNFDINYVPSIKKGSEKYNRIVRKIYENYLLNFAKDKDFATDYSKLIQYLVKFKEQFNVDFQTIAKASIAPLNKHQKFVLGIFIPSLPFDKHEYFEAHWRELDTYFLLKYLVDKDVVEIDASLKEKINTITESKIIELARIFEWNELISPIKDLRRLSRYNPSFLEDIKRFIQKFSREDINPINIGEAIYDSLTFYKIHHLRLWLYGFVNENRCSYVGFRECFRELSPSEQKYFRNKLSTQIKEEVYEVESLEVEPCHNILSTQDTIIIYKALAENIYFRDGSIMLRKDNKEYTNVFPEPFASSGLNRIPKSSIFNKFEFIINVEGKDIKEVIGFEEFFNQIQTGEIEKALGKIVEPKSSRDNRDESYAEDWELRKEIIDYLNNQQIDKFSPKVINEPKSKYRRIDKNFDIETFEKIHLYTILTADGYGIVWENIDMTEDRATFIFKATKETYEQQIEKIAHSIVAYGQFRSTLISAREESRLQIFKNDHGYIAKIHKQRGKNQPFANWQAKLENALLQPIQILPDFQQIRSLRDWQAEMPFSPRINKKVEKINESDIKTVHFDFANPNSTEEKIVKTTDKTKIDKKIEILNRLREINQQFQI